MSTSTLVLLVASLAVLFFALVVTALFLHKRAASQQLTVIGAIGIIEKQLDPEGAIIVNGELWRARTRDGLTMTNKTRILVVGAQAHLLLVEPAPTSLS